MDDFDNNPLKIINWNHILRVSVEEPLESDLKE